MKTVGALPWLLNKLVNWQLSRRATKEIEQIVENIQLEISELVRAMELEMTEVIEELLKLLRTKDLVGYCQSSPCCC